MTFNGLGAGLIVQSVLIAFFGSAVTLFQLRLIRQQGAGDSLFWMLMSSVSMAVSIWTMHFVGMLAYDLPIDLHYDIPYLILSFIVPWLFSILAFENFRRHELSLRNTLVSGVLLGIAISLMHLIGLSAIIISPALVFNGTFLSAALLIAVVTSCLALLMSCQKSSFIKSENLRLLASAVIMTLGMSCLYCSEQFGVNIQPGSVGGDTGMFVHPNVAAKLLVMVATTWLLSSGGFALALRYFRHKFSPDSNLSKYFQFVFVFYAIGAIFLAGGVAIGLYAWLLAGLVLLAYSINTYYRLQIKRQKLVLSEIELANQTTALNEHAIVSITDVKGNIIYANNKFIEISGYSMAELMGNNHRMLKSGAHSAEFFKEMWKTIANGKVWQGEIQNRAKAGYFYWVQATIVPFLDQFNKPYQYVAIRTDITRQKLAEAEVTYQYDNLERLVAEKTKELKISEEAANAANLAKSDFLANMSHEIRTPMNAIIGMTHLALKTKLEPKQYDYLNKISLSATSLLRLINEILDFSKVDAGKMEVEHVPFNLNDLVNNISTVALNVGKKNVTFMIKTTPGLPNWLHGDILRIGQVLINLINNAIKFTESGVVILDIALKETRADRVLIKFAVQDQGIGMSPEQINKLFSAFVQADNSVSRKYGGTGLGLAISKQLVELMGGEIKVQSQIGVGSTFEFGLWLDIAEAPVVPTFFDADTIEDIYSIQGIRVLIAEDNSINQQIVTELLESAGVNVTIANNGRELLDLLAEAPDPLPWSMILMDIQMPELDGHQANTQIRSESRYANLPVIAMTAHAMPEMLERFKAEGMVDHLTKPIDPDALYRCIKRWGVKPIADDLVEPTQAVAEVEPLVKVEIPTVYGLNIEAGLHCVGNSKKLYRTILKTFVEDFQDFPQAIKVERLEDRHKAERSAHTLKGVAGSVGALELSALASKVEQAFRQGNDSELDALIEELESVMPPIIQTIKEVSVQTD